MRFDCVIVSKEKTFLNPLYKSWVRRLKAFPQLLNPRSLESRIDSDSHTKAWHCGKSDAQMEMCGTVYGTDVGLFTGQ